MSSTLLITGLACVIAAIVGGGLKAFGIEIPVLQSAKRQWVLAVLGVVLLSGSFIEKDEVRTMPATATVKRPMIDRDKLFSELQENKIKIERIDKSIAENEKKYAQQEQEISQAEQRIAYGDAHIEMLDKGKKTDQDAASLGIAILDNGAQRAKELMAIQEARSVINEGRKNDSKGREAIGILKQRNNEIERLLATN